MASKAEVPLWHRTTLTIVEYAALTGMDRRTVAGLIAAGLPTFTPPGLKQPRIVRAAADAWIAEQGADQVARLLDEGTAA